MSQEKLKDIPAFLKQRVTPENIKTNFNLFATDYKHRYIDTGARCSTLDRLQPIRSVGDGVVQALSLRPLASPRWAEAETMSGLTQCSLYAGSFTPMIHLIGGVFGIAYTLALPAERRHYQHAQEAKRSGGGHH